MNGLVSRARTLLETLGDVYAESDAAFLLFCAEQAQAEILNACNLREMPETLEAAAAGWAAARFLEGKKDLGLLEGLAGFDYAAAVQQIQEGDTSVRYFENPSPEQRLEQLIEMLKPSREMLLAHRRMKW